MTDLFTAAALRDWQAAQQRLAYSPHGTKRQREAELRRITTEILEREVESRSNAQ